MVEVRRSNSSTSPGHVSLYPKDIERQLYSCSHYRTGWGLESHITQFSVTPHPNSTGWGQLLCIRYGIQTSAVMVVLSLKDRVTYEIKVAVEGFRIMFPLLWRGVRVVDCGDLLSRWPNEKSVRRFKSYSLRYASSVRPRCKWKPCGGNSWLCTGTSSLVWLSYP